METSTTDVPPRAQLCFNRAQSDHLAVLDAHQKWTEARATGGNRAGHAFCDRHFLSERTLQGMTDMASQFWHQIADLGLLPVDDRKDSEMSASRRRANANADNPLVLKAVLCAGLFPNVLRAQPGKKLPNLTQQKQSVTIHPSSFNASEKVFETGWLVYHEKVQGGSTAVAKGC